MTRVLHTGDTHLGYQQYHAPERREDFLGAFRQVVDDAIEADVDAVVHAGDLFHDRRPTLPDVLGTLDVLERLDDADVPFLAIVGNHEAKRDAQWLDLFEALGLATRLDETPVEIGTTAFYGLDFVPRSKRENLDVDFDAHDADQAALVAHGLFEPFDLGEWDPTEILDATDLEIDAVLLGDNHDAGTAEVEGTWLTYCGSTERASADEREPRGYNLVTFDDGVDVARRGLDTREFVFVDLDLAEDEGTERVRERVGEYDLEDAVVVVHVDGDGEPITPASVEEFASGQGALVARVTDHREIAGDETVEVNFADPDDAVRDRLRELGLSEAARDLDETIRASKVADSRVADTVEARVRDLLKGDGDAFDTVPTDDAVDSGGAEPEEADDAEVRDDGSTEDEPTPVVTNVAAGSEPNQDEADAPASDEDETSVDEPADGAADPARTTVVETVDDQAVTAANEAEEDANEEPTEATEQPAEEPDTDGQATMEEYS